MTERKQPLLGLALSAAACALGWVVIILAVRWALLLPPPIIARVVGVAALFAGCALVFVALVRVELAMPAPRRRRRAR